jgi:hypothetical protein
MVRTAVATPAHREVARRDAVTYLRRLHASSELTGAEKVMALDPAHRHPKHDGVRDCHGRVGHVRAGIAASAGPVMYRTDRFRGEHAGRPPGGRQHQDSLCASRCGEVSGHGLVGWTRPRPVGSSCPHPPSAGRRLRPVCQGPATELVGCSAHPLRGEPAIFPIRLVERLPVGRTTGQGDDRLPQGAGHQRAPVAP